MISDLILLAEKYYSRKKFAHAMRVAGYAYDAAQHDDRIDPEYAFMVGLAHDLIEDTECSPDDLQQILGLEMMSAVLILTKDDKSDYQTYIKSIINSQDALAFLVKRADMKDHLEQLDTLTDKLKEKYIPVLHYFL